MFAYSRVLVSTAIIVSCFVSSAKSANLIDLIEWTIGEKSPELRAEGDGESPPGGQRNCLCDGPSCICCMDFNLTFVDLGGPGCVRMKYLSQDDGFAVNVSYGNSLIHSQIVKGPNPEPSCMNIISRVAQLCARLTELAPTADGLRGCLQLEPTLLGDPQIEFPLGCFRSGPEGMSMEPNKSNTTAIDESESDVDETDEPDTEGGINTAEIIQAVNESAEEGIAFFSNLLGLTFGKSNNTEAANNKTTTESTVVPTQILTSSPQPDKNEKRGGKKLHVATYLNEV